MMSLMNLKGNFNGNTFLPPPRAYSHGRRAWTPTLDTKLLERADIVKGSAVHAQHSHWDGCSPF